MLSKFELIKADLSAVYKLVNKTFHKLEAEEVDYKPVFSSSLNESFSYANLVEYLLFNKTTDISTKCNIVVQAEDLFGTACKDSADELYKKIVKQGYSDIISCTKNFWNSLASQSIIDLELEGSNNYIDYETSCSSNKEFRECIINRYETLCKSSGEIPDNCETQSL